MPASGAAPLRVRILGPTRAWRGDEEIDLGSPRRRSLFAILALHANQAVSREDLVDGLWGDDPPAKAVGVLYTYVSGLRRVLETESGRRAAVLTSVDSGYSLRLAPDELDEQRFDRLLATAQRQREDGALAAALATLDDALALWHGTPLAGLTGPFVALHRARLDERRRSALEWRGELRLATGDHAAAVAELTDLVREHPLRERPHALLMVALHRSGRRADALDVFAAAQRKLVAELGIEPGPPLRRVYRRILAGEPVSAADIDPRARQAPPPATADPIPAPPGFFVGREAELAQLRATLTGLADGRGGCLWVEGDPGSGKSALLAAALAGVDTSGYRVVWTAGDELGRHPADDGVDAVDRFLGFVTRTAAQAPLVMIVDDVQWADSAGMLAWSRAARRTEQLPFVLIGACRTCPGAAGFEQPRNAVAAAGGRIIGLGPLSSAATVEFAARAMAAPPGPALAEFLGSAAGNPAAIHALLDSAVRADAVRPGAGVVDLDPDSPFDRWHALTTVVLRRLDVLSARTKDLLRWAALLGTEFDLGDVAVVTHVAPTELVDAVDEATAAGVLVDTVGRLAFRDPTVRRTLYEQRSAGVRAALHREAAQALAEAGVPAERVATQLLAAAPAADAWTVRWLLANVDAVAGHDPATALALLDRATAGGSVDGDREALAVRRVLWLFRLGRRPTAEAHALLASTRDVDHAAQMRLLLAHLTFQRGDAAAAVADLRQAERDGVASGHWRARYRTLRARFERAGLADLAAAEHTARAALADATGAGDARATAEAAQELWHIATTHRDHVAALAHVDHALAALDGDADPGEFRIDLLDHRASTLQNLDRLAEASETLARSRVLAARLPRPAVLPHVATAVHDYWLGRWDDALAELGGSPHHGVAALIAAHRGDRAALRSHLDAPGDREDGEFLVVARAIDAGQRADGQAELAALDPLLAPDHGRTSLRHQWLPDLVRLALDAGDHDRVDAALAWCRQEADHETTPARAAAALARCEAMVAGDPEPLLATAEHYDRVGRVVELAATLADAAVLLAAHGDTDRAQRVLDEAVRTFDDLGAVFDIGRVAARLRRHDPSGLVTTGHRPLPAGWGALSGIERAIAELAAADQTNVDIGTALGLPRRTVQLHLSRIMQKLGARSRADFAGRLARTLAGRQYEPDRRR